MSTSEPVHKSSVATPSNHQMTDAVYITIIFSAAAYFFFPVLDVTNINWIRGDIAQHYLGWAFYRQAEGWDFPITFVDRVGYPFGISIAMTDSIPLIAIPLRFLDNVLPYNFQYLGWFQLSSVVFGGMFGMLIGRKLGHRGLTPYLIGLFFAVSPIMVFRMHGHTSLTAHWLVLWAFLIFISMPVGAKNLDGRKRAQLISTIAIAALVHPYILLMVYMFVLAIALRAWIADAAILHVIQGLIVAALVGIGLMILVGFIPINDPKSVAVWGYRLFSFNLLAPINPMNYDGLLYGRLPTAGQLQYEGYAYLGLGMLILGVLAIIQISRRSVRATWSRSAFLQCALPIGLMSLGAVILAASATVTLGPFTIVTIPLPDFVEHGLSIFRSSGRLFWPVFYVIMVIIFLTLLSVPQRILIPTLIGCFILQIADLWSLGQSVSRVHRTAGPTTEWIRDLAPELSGVQHIVVLRPRLCHTEDRVGNGQSFIDFSMVALETGATLNSFYSARHTNEERRYQCEEQVDRFLEGPLMPDTAYVVHASIATQLPEDRFDSECMQVGPAFLCQSFSPRGE